MCCDKSKFIHEIHIIWLYYVKYFFAESFCILIILILLHYQL